MCTQIVKKDIYISMFTSMIGTSLPHNLPRRHINFRKERLCEMCFERRAIIRASALHHLWASQV